MLQRIQSLFLLAATACSTSLFFAPIASIDEGRITFGILGYMETATSSLISANYFLTSLLSLTVLVQFLTTFFFRNRKSQLFLAQMSMILLVMCTVLIMLYIDLFPPESDNVSLEAEYNWNIILPAISWLFNWLAVRAIRKEGVILKSGRHHR